MPINIARRDFPLGVVWCPKGHLITNESINPLIDIAQHYRQFKKEDPVFFENLRKIIFIFLTEHRDDEELVKFFSKKNLGVEVEIQGECKALFTLHTLPEEY